MEQASVLCYNDQCEPYLIPQVQEIIESLN